MLRPTDRRQFLKTAATSALGLGLAHTTAWSKGDWVVWFENPGDLLGKWTMHVL
jgi:hypothetical protein